jgi:hypothetical protein
MNLTTLLYIGYLNSSHQNTITTDDYYAEYFSTEVLWYRPVFIITNWNYFYVGIFDKQFSLVISYVQYVPDINLSLRKWRYFHFTVFIAWLVIGWTLHQPIIERSHNKHSSVGRVTDYGLDGPGIESRWGRDFSNTSRPALRPTQPPVQWVPDVSRG